MTCCIGNSEAGSPVYGGGCRRGELVEVNGRVGRDLH